MIQSPIKVIRKASPPTASKINSSLSNNEYFKVRIEITENNKQKAQNQKYF